MKGLTLRLSIVAILAPQLLVESLPLLIEVLPVILILLHCELFLLLLIHPQGFLKCEWVDLFENGFQGDQTFLEDPRCIH